MIVTIDAMAKRYGYLPSDIMSRASTFDMVVMDAAISYESYLEKQHRGSSSGAPPDVSEEELLKILERAKND
jgi:hypothetical protein